jgi:hypothetical protein
VRMLRSSMIVCSLCSAHADVESIIGPTYQRPSADFCIRHVNTFAQVKHTLEKLNGTAGKEVDHTSRIREAEGIVMQYGEACEWQLHPKLRVLGYTD